MAHLGSAAAAAAAAAMSQEMLGHVHSNSSNLLTLNYQLEAPGGNLTNASNSPSSNLNEKTSANSHLLSSHSHLHHSSSHQLNHQYAQLHHQPLINSNNVSIFAANQCDTHQPHHHHSQHALLQHGSPIIDLNGSYNGRPGQANASSNRMTPNNSNESDACHTVVVKSEDAAIYPLPDEEYMADGHLNCSSDQSYRPDAVKLEAGAESNGPNNVTVSYSTAGYNGYDQLQLGNLSTQLILHPSSPLLGSTSHLQSALNNHSLHHQSNHLLGGIHHSVIVENGDHPNEQSPSSNGKASTGDSNDRQSNYNLTLMTAAAVTNATGAGLQHSSVIQASGSNSETFGLPPSKRSRKSQSSSNNNSSSSGFHSMELEDDQHHVQHSNSSLNGQHSQLHSQHLPTTTTANSHSADFNLCSENQSAWFTDHQAWGTAGDYIYIPKI